MKRKGAVIPLFAVLLPVLLILSGFAVNLAYMQLIRTELRVATDASARAGGVAFSELQDVDEALSYAQSTAALNTVNGDPLLVDITDNTGDIDFGVSTRANYDSRYQFQVRNTAMVRSQSALASAIRVRGRRDTGSLSGPVDLFFGTMFPAFEPVASTVATQLDRDIALILDRSGSMAFHEDWTGDASGGSWSQLFDWVDDMLDYYRDNGGNWQWVQWGSWWWQGGWQFVWTDPDMQAAYNSMLAYKNQLTNYYHHGGDAPSPSRWDALDTAVNAFLNVLDATDQDEMVSLGSFNSSGTLNFQLQSNYTNIRNWVANTRPGGGTAIHDGLSQSFSSLYTALGRPYAAKTIVVLTDGQNNAGGQVILDEVDSILASHNVVIHTVTFSPGADTTTMAEVASRGGGKHFHANETSELVAIFEEIANNLPTLITE